MRPAKFLDHLPLGWKLSLTSIGLMALVLCTALAGVSLEIWRNADTEGTRVLSDASASTARLLEVYDDTARRAAAKDFAIFRREFDGDFVLSSAPGADGKPQPQLSMGGKPINRNFELVDRFTQLSGAAATVFARTGDDFLRITTSLKKDDGGRAVGTLLDRKHPAYQAMLDGTSFTGRATLFGKTYMTRYEPIRQGDRTIGILFIGSDMSDVLGALRKTMAAQHPYDAGKVYAVDLRVGPDQGRIFGLEGAARLDEKDAAAAAFLERLRHGGERSVIESSWSPARADGEAPNRAAYSTNAAWNWAIVSEAPTRQIMAPARATLTVLWGAGLAAMATLFVATGWVARRLVSRPVGNLAASLARLADGDLSAAMSWQGNDEIGRLTQAMEGFRVRLGSTLANVRDDAQTVATASAQIAQGNHDLSQRTEEQATSLQQTASTMDELSSTVHNNADNARQASQLALGASDIASRGGEVVGRVVDTMKDINDSSRKISDIIGVIDGIAFQTNILALNAAVEAARAGEQGRGFAVVASEVRSLAQRSAEAAKQIKVLITDSVAQVEQGTTLVDSAGRTMEEIVGAIRRVSDIVAEISSASTEQSAGVSEVGQTVTRMDQMTQQNATLVEQSATAARGLEQQARRLAQAIAAFRLAPGHA